MSFHSPLPKSPVGPSSSDACTRRVRCDLPGRLDVLPDEVELIEMWLGGLIADLIGSSGAADSTKQQEAKEKK